MPATPLYVAHGSGYIPPYYRYHVPQTDNESGASIVMSAAPQTALPDWLNTQSEWQINQFKGGINQLEGAINQLKEGINQFAVQLQTLDIKTENSQRARRNTRIGAGNGDVPFRKWIPGHGADLARTFFPNDIDNIVDPPQPSALGSLPPVECGTPGALTNEDIIQLIIFYNHDFGITSGDDMALKRDKFTSFIHDEEFF